MMLSKLLVFMSLAFGSEDISCDGIHWNINETMLKEKVSSVRTLDPNDYWALIKTIAWGIVKPEDIKSCDPMSIFEGKEISKLTDMELTALMNIQLLCVGDESELIQGPGAILRYTPGISREVEQEVLDRLENGQAWANYNYAFICQYDDIFKASEGYSRIQLSALACLKRSILLSNFNFSLAYLLLLDAFMEYRVIPDDYLEFLECTTKIGCFRVALHRAASLGDARAMKLLGNRYLTHFGSARNAKLFWDKALELGYSPAAYSPEKLKEVQDPVDTTIEYSAGEVLWDMDETSYISMVQNYKNLSPDEKRALLKTIVWGVVPYESIDKANIYDCIDHRSDNLTPLEIAALSKAILGKNRPQDVKEAMPSLLKRSENPWSMISLALAMLETDVSEYKDEIGTCLAQSIKLAGGKFSLPFNMLAKAMTCLSLDRERFSDEVSRLIHDALSPYKIKFTTLDLYLRAVELGDVLSFYDLAFGYKIANYFDQATSLFKQAHEMGLLVSTGYYAVHLYMGNGCKKDQETAFKLALGVFEKTKQPALILLLIQHCSMHPEMSDRQQILERCEETLKNNPAFAIGERRAVPIRDNRFAHNLSLSITYVLSILKSVVVKSIFTFVHRVVPQSIYDLFKRIIKDPQPKKASDKTKVPVPEKAEKPATRTQDGGKALVPIKKTKQSSTCILF